jgi:hypothetical protein
MLHFAIAVITIWALWRVVEWIFVAPLNWLQRANYRLARWNARLGGGGSQQPAVRIASALCENTHFRLVLVDLQVGPARSQELKARSR